MEHYRNIPIWENRRRRRRLSEFRERVVSHFSAGHTQSPVGKTTLEDDESVDTRRALNLRIEEVKQIVASAMGSAVVQWSPPPAIGGRPINVDLFDNLFNLDRFSIAPSWLIDALDRVIGVYEADASASWRRTVNPIWWLGRGLAWFSRAPFRILNVAGFHTSRFEESLSGRLVRAVILLIPLIAAGLGILDRVGWLGHLGL